MQSRSGPGRRASPMRTPRCGHPSHADSPRHSGPNMPDDFPSSALAASLPPSTLGCGQHPAD
eukprot:9055522-Karenia_brevis.AAC.1